MPELPEVETVMRGLRARLLGRSLTRVTVTRPALRFPTPPHLAATLRGRTVLGFRRRAKYILMRLDNGDSLLLHLGMSGRVAIGVGGGLAAPHEQMILETDDGGRVALVDPRRFGCLDLVPTGAEDAHRLLRDLGPEPLTSSFNGPFLAERLAGKRGPIKTVLLDQRVVAGLGNIYVCEALFRARLSPFLPADTLSLQECLRLAAAIRAVLEQAIAAGGSSLRDYAQPDGQLGYFQHAWRVYGKEGAPCPDCPGPPACAGVRRVAQAGRSTFLCPQHQG